MQASVDPWLARARELHQRSIVVDSHCDTTQLLMRPEWDLAERHTTGHVDTPRLREGGISVLILAVYAPGPFAAGEGVAAAKAQIARIHETVRRYECDLRLARSADDVRRAKADGKIAILIGIEGGFLIEESLDALRQFREAGAIYMTLTHGVHTTWADSSGVHDPLAPLHNGLTDLGRQVVREMNRLGMMVDVSHVSDATFWDVLEVSRAPAIASHSSCRAVSPHRRNLSDDMIQAIARSGGVVQINFAAAFVDPAFPPIDGETVRLWSKQGGFEKSPYAAHVTPLHVLVDHFDHALRLVGPDHVGIGSDFDGVAALPRGMEDCAKLPHLTATLLQRGHDEIALRCVLGENFLRVMEQCHAMARGGRVAAAQPSVGTPCSGWDSLAFAIQAIAAAADHPIDHDDVCAVLAISPMICALPGEPDLSSWTMFARDAFLIEAGRVFGMQIRQIHPPQAARGLERAAEFDQHFDASYRPLIIRALEHQQPVLAWQGWPGERARSWGIIRSACDSGIGFSGVTMWSPQELASPARAILHRPPTQLYVVERLTLAAPTLAVLREAALDHALHLDDVLPPRFGVLSGSVAFEEWIARLRAADQGCLPGERAYAASLMAGLESWRRFLARHEVTGAMSACMELLDVLRRLQRLEGPSDLRDQRIALLRQAQAAVKRNTHPPAVAGRR